jgi:HD-like signal output (HDOD) protein
VLSEDDFHAQIIDDIDSNQLVLPTLPEVALKIREVVEKDGVSAREIASVVATDAALSGRLIQVANSPVYRGKNPIEDIQQAVARMGFTVTRDIVTSLAMKQMFQATHEETDRRLRDIWEHSTEVAAISSMLTKQFTSLKADQAMLAGLVHDIGSLPILVKAEDFPELLEDTAMLDQYVRNLHTKIGKLILENWEFPAEIIAVACEHEDLDRDSGDAIDYVDVVQVANIQSHIGQDHPLARIDMTHVPSCIKFGFGGEGEEINMIAVFEEGDKSELQSILAG